ncbi:MAG TPA: electron transfer flavoprotein subunit beta/FixA family protein [Gemmatimonadaceae bacterium]|nr:electron transfer flavoprotein subunit beta/FixA family protein [Gemmatimonadaceae bacterium]
MKIAVCIKRVPVMDVRFRIAADGKSVDETGLKYDVNDFDLWAVEAALQLKEKTGAGEVVVVSLGPDAVQEQIRKALSMGADRGIQLKADRAPADPLSVARALAAELKAAQWDVIFFGKVAIDSADQSVGPMVAELLGLPCVSAISSLEIANGRGTARRELEGASEIVEFPLPVVLTVDEGLNKERLPNLKGIMAAKKKPLETKPAQLDAGTITVAAMELPAERAPGRIIGEGAAAVPELVRLLQTEAKVL